MKKKYIVELDEDTINECKVLFGQGYANNAEYAISQGIPYNPSGDLISRDALKEHKVYSEERHEYVVPVYSIDNATTVDLWQMRQEATENALKKAEVLYDRPKGKWIIVKDEKYGNNVKCPFCGKELAGTDLNFCCKCGADMRKGGAE